MIQMLARLQIENEVNLEDSIPRFVSVNSPTDRVFSQHRHYQLKLTRKLSTQVHPRGR